MNSKWPSKKIPEIVNFLNHKRVPVKSLDRAKRQGHYPYYGASGIVDYIDDYIFDGTYLLVSEDGENLRSRKTPIAFQVSGKFWVNNHAHILEEKEEGILDYLEYYFSQINLNPYITGAVQPKLNKANLEVIEVSVPPIRVRREINRALNLLSTKIQLNHQINQTLEQIAQALFKSWFVDFDPVKAKIKVLEAGGSEENALLAAMQVISSKNTEELAAFQTERPQKYAELRATAKLFPHEMEKSELGEIPEGWRVSSLHEIVDVIYGAPFKSKQFNDLGQGKPLIRIRDLRNERSNLYTEEEHPRGYLVQNGDLLVGMDGEFKPYIWGGGPAWMNQRICCFKPKKNYSTGLIKEIVTPLLRQIELTATATTVIHLGKGDIDKFDFIDAGDELLTCFSKMVDNLIQKIVMGKDSNRTLEQLRDTLLPKLLSGELDVSVLAEALEAEV